VRRAVSAVLILLFSPLALCAEQGFFVAEVWVELDPLVADSTERPLSTEAATERLLAEAQDVVSGMVYGYRFVYTPSDPSREVTEEFTLEPYARIVRGDPALQILQTWVDGDRLYARVSYEVSAEQRGWYNAWQSSANARSSGIGVSSLFLGPERKMDAIADGVRSAVREHVRAIEFTRPQRITGAALLAVYPEFAIVRGNYQAEVDILLQIDRIERYRTY
jgi:hypothetical protein